MQPADAYRHNVCAIGAGRVLVNPRVTGTLQVEADAIVLAHHLGKKLVVSTGSSSPST